MLIDCDVTNGAVNVQSDTSCGIYTILPKSFECGKVDLHLGNIREFSCINISIIFKTVLYIRQ